MTSLNAKIAWVTGGGSGIGRGAALALAAEGMTVVLSGRRREALEETADMISGETLVLPLDVMERDAVYAAGQQIVEKYGKIDLLFNNHGTNVTDRNWAGANLDGWDTVIDVNIKGVYNCIAAVLPTMRVQKDGVIVNTSSWAGRFYSNVAGVAYGASKHAVMSMNSMVNREEGKNGIRACAICPAEVATPILERRPVPIPEETMRQYMQPEDMGELVVSVAKMNPRATVNEILVSPTAFQK